MVPGRDEGSTVMFAFYLRENPGQFSAHTDQLLVLLLCATAMCSLVYDMGKRYQPDLETVPLNLPRAENLRVTRQNAPITSGSFPSSAVWPLAAR
jgi:hypothetical protein